MTDVWKSNPRHFCTFCSCWIADNKPSKDFHEKGKRHQENVKKKISEMQKKSRKQQKEEDEMENTMKEIEQKAIEAFKKDIKSNKLLNAAYKKKYREKEEAEAAEAAKKAEAENKKEDIKPKEDVKPKEKKDSKWVIAFSDEGYPYFWNEETNEVQWTKPDDYDSPRTKAESGETSRTESKPKFRPISEQVQESEEEESDESAELSPLPTADIPLPPPDIPLPPPEKAASEEPISEEEELPVVPDRKRPPMPSNKAYGTWANVPEPQPDDHVDLQLPQVQKKVEEIIVPVKETKIKFHTKKTNSIADGLVAFKKRKLAQGTRNLKKREDDR